jgi:hypothetical protein
MGHLLTLKCAHSPLNLCILSLASIPFTLTTLYVRAKFNTNSHETDYSDYMLYEHTVLMSGVAVTFRLLKLSIQPWRASYRSGEHAVSQVSYVLVRRACCKSGGLCACQVSFTCLSGEQVVVQERQLSVR